MSLVARQSSQDSPHRSDQMDLLNGVMDVPGVHQDEQPFIQIEEQPVSRWFHISKTAFGVSSAVAAVGLLALSIIQDYGDSWNAVITMGGGLAAQFAFQALPSRSTIDFEKDLLTDYAAEFFLIITQIYLNVPQPRWVVRWVFGMFNALLGAQIATKVDTVLQWTPENDRTAETDVLMEDPRTMHMITGNHALSRRTSEVVKLSFGVIAIGVCNAYPKYTTIPLQVAWLVTGHAIGCLFHETIHTIRRQKEKEFEATPHSLNDTVVPLSTRLPTSIKALRLIEQVEQVVGVVLPGFLISFALYDKKYLTPVSILTTGITMGMIRHIDWLRDTKTRVDRLPELKRREDDSRPLYLRAADVAKYAITLGVIAFLGVAMYQGTAVDRWALGTFGVSLFGSYIGARYIDKYDLPSNPLINTLSFFIRHSSAPMLYILINQVMKIGDIALNTYPTAYIVVSCVAYASLGIGLGTHAGERATSRKRQYPAETNTLSAALYSNFWGQQVIGQV